MTGMWKRVGGLTLGAATMMILAGTLTLSAQEPKAKPADAPKARAKRALDPSRRVPNHFAHLGLTDAQRESIYKIQAKHTPKIDALQKQIDAMEKQIDEMQAQMVKECETVLTAAQKQMLADRRTGAAAARKKKSAAKAQD
ncbi:MAG: hypothetical protein ACYC61_28995 [Isosphaeraceae bacterium]